MNIMLDFYQINVVNITSLSRAVTHFTSYKYMINMLGVMHNLVELKNNLSFIFQKLLKTTFFHDLFCEKSLIFWFWEGVKRVYLGQLLILISGNVFADRLAKPML